MRGVVAVLVGVVLAAGACAQEGAGRDVAVPGSARSTTSPSSAGGQPGGPNGDGEGASASVFGEVTAPLLGGGTFEGTSVAGADLALWFWSPW